MPFKISFSLSLGLLAISLHYFSNKEKKKRIESLKVYVAFCLVISFQPIKNQCCPRVEDRTFSRTSTGRLRGQGRELELQDQGQVLKIVSSRTSSRPRTFSRTPPLTRNYVIICDVNSFLRVFIGERSKNLKFVRLAM